MYKLTLNIYPINCDETLTLTYDGKDVHAMKREIDNFILYIMNKYNANDGETFVEMNIEKDGEYYDHDEQTVFVDLQNNCVKYGF